MTPPGEVCLTRPVDPNPLSEATEESGLAEWRTDTTFSPRVDERLWRLAASSHVLEPIDAARRLIRIWEHAPRRSCYRSDTVDQMSDVHAVLFLLLLVAVLGCGPRTTGSTTPFAAGATASRPAAVEPSPEPTPVFTVGLADSAAPTPKPAHAAPAPVMGLETTALRRASNQHRVPLDQLSVAHSARTEYPLHGRAVTHFKIADSLSGEIYGVALDDAGQPVGEAALEGRERDAHVARYGKLDPRLAERLASADPDEPLPVTIWVESPPDTCPQKPPTGSGLTQGQTEMLHAERVACVAAAAQIATEPVMERLAQLGYATTAGTLVAVVYAHLPLPAIREVAQWDEVLAVYLASGPYRPAAP